MFLFYKIFVTTFLPFNMQFVDIKAFTDTMKIFIGLNKTCRDRANGKDTS